MPDTFIAVDITTDAATMADDAIGRLQARWPGWVPDDAGLVEATIEEVAPMAQNAAEAAVRVPPAVFRQVGQGLHGIPYLNGVPAAGTVTFSITDTDDHTIFAGDAVSIDGFTFTVDADTPTGGAVTVPGVPVTAADAGVDFNGLAGDLVAPITAMAFVADITLDAPTAGGVDAESDDAYQSRVATLLRLQTKALVTAADIETFARAWPGVGHAKAFVDHTARTVNVVVTDQDGATVASATKTALAAALNDPTIRLANWTTTVDDPVYQAVNVAYSIHPLPGYATADVLASVDAMLAQALTPGQWGIPLVTGDASETSAIWEPDQVIRINTIVTLIGNVRGVGYVPTVTLNGSAADLVLATGGNVGLPTAGTMTGTII